jgi:hypothetical protein
MLKDNDLYTGEIETVLSLLSSITSHSPYVELKSKRLEYIRDV